MIRRLMVIGLLLIGLMIIGCSKEYYPWTDSKLPDWVIYNKQNAPYSVLVEQADFGPVNKIRPLLWCYKYKTVVIVYELDNKGQIWKFTVWRN